MRVIRYLRRFFSCCFSNRTKKTKATKPIPTNPIATAVAAAGHIKNRLSASLADLFKERQEPQDDEDSFIDDALLAADHQLRRRHHLLASPTKCLIVGTIFGHRRGRVCFCFQSDPAVAPPFLFEFSIPTQRLAEEMDSGVLRIALECHGHQQPSEAERRQPAPVWKAYCNGRDVGYAVRRRPTEKDCAILDRLKTVSAGAGVLGPSDQVSGWKSAWKDEELGVLMYMRASYERVVGSRDSVSYHLMNPGGRGRSPNQELSIFLLRAG